ncbi:hypothetical protein [Streptomyces sp. NPDC093094]|uniref:hypothetical protein n=1 Tax=Streptomyces sp. NPDC093094 TaxID=3366026 RepID=UPI003823AEA4
MEPPRQLEETLRRLDMLVDEQGLDRSELLDTGKLAARTALPERDVRALLAGECLPADSVNDRVRARIKALADANLARTGRKMAALAAEVAAQLGVSELWARRICDGSKVPNVELLHGIVDFFGVEDGEAFFTVPAATALDRALRRDLARLERPALDPVQALMTKYGVVAADLRRHGALSAQALERLLAGVIQSVMPPKEEADR